MLVVFPTRANDVAAHDGFNGQRIQSFDHHRSSCSLASFPGIGEDVFDGYVEAVVGYDMRSTIEPELRDRGQYLAFADQFEERFVGQDEEEDRTIIDTLNIAWEILSMLGPEHLTRVRDEDISKYHRWKEHGEQREDAVSGGSDG